MFNYQLLHYGCVLCALGRILGIHGNGLGNLELAGSVRDTAPGAGHGIKPLVSPSSAFLTSLECVNHISFRVNEFHEN